MGVTAWRESVAEWVGPIRHTERARIGATVQTYLCSWRGQPDHIIVEGCTHGGSAVCQLRSTFT